PRARRRRRAQRREPRIQQRGYSLDDATLAGGVPALEQRNDAQATVFDPLLEPDELVLEPSQFLLVVLLGERLRLPGPLPVLPLALPFLLDDILHRVFDGL